MKGAAILRKNVSRHYFDPILERGCPDAGISCALRSCVQSSIGGSSTHPVPMQHQVSSPLIKSARSDSLFP